MTRKHQKLQPEDMLSSEECSPSIKVLTRITVPLLPILTSVLGKFDFRVNLMRNNVFPHHVTYDICSSVSGC